MNEPILLKTKYANSSYSRAFFWHWLQSPLSWVFLVAGIVLLGISFTAFFSNESSEFRKAYCLILGSIFLARPLLRKFYFMSQLRKSPLHGKDIYYTLGADGITTRSDVSEGMIKWSALYLTVTTPDGFLLYPQKNFFSWIQRSDFASAADFDEFAALLAVQSRNRVLGKKKASPA